MEQPDKGQIILYQTQDGESKIEVTLANETQDTLKMFLKKESYSKIQLLHFLQQLNLMGKNMKLHSITLT